MLSHCVCIYICLCGNCTYLYSYILGLAYLFMIHRRTLSISWDNASHIFFKSWIVLLVTFILSVTYSEAYLKAEWHERSVKENSFSWHLPGHLSFPSIFCFFSLHLHLLSFAALVRQTTENIFAKKQVISTSNTSCSQRKARQEI